MSQLGVGPPLVRPGRSLNWIPYKPPPQPAVLPTLLYHRHLSLNPSPFFATNHADLRQNPHRKDNHP